MQPLSRRLVHGLYYGSLQGALRALDATAGSRSKKVRSVALYMRELIAAGRYAEVDALIAHGLGKLRLPGLERLRQMGAASAPAILIDAVRDVLQPDGSLAPKQTFHVYPSDEAPILASIVIPCYNYGAYLDEAVASALAQTLADCEFIVVDDGSTDPHTNDVVTALAERGDVRVIRKENGGLPMARNTGIEAARGEYICCLDADDVLEPTYLETAVFRMACDSSVGFCYSWVQFFGDFDEVWPTEDFAPQRALIGNFTSVAAVFRRDDWRAVGGYSPKMRGGFEDWEFWIRLSSLGRRGVAIRWPLFLHRRHGRTMTHDAKDMQNELVTRMTGLNPLFYTDASFRERLLRLKGRPTDKKAVLAKFANAKPSQPTDAKPHLLVVVRWLKRGGAEVLLLGILRSLSADWRITLVTTDDDPHDMHADFSDVSSDIHHLAEAYRAENRVLALAHLAQSRGAQAILTSGCAWFVNVLPELEDLVGSRPIYTILHNEVPAGPFRASLDHDDRIAGHIGVSARTTDALVANGIAQEKVHEIPNGIDTELFRPIDPAAREGKRSLLFSGADAGTLCLLWVGRMSKEKRPEAFVEVFEALARQRPVRAVMVGTGPLRDAVLERATDLGVADRIAFVDRARRDVLPDYYNAADLLVLTSATEGMPLVVLEAVACGCPVAATDVGDVARLVSPGANGTLVPSDAPQRLYDAILLDDMAACLAPERRASIAEGFRQTRYTQEAMAGTYQAILAGALVDARGTGDPARSVGPAHT